MNICPICRDNMDGLDDRSICKTKCGHTYHVNCLEEWFSAIRGADNDAILTCPTCRRENIAYYPIFLDDRYVSGPRIIVDKQRPFECNEALSANDIILIELITKKFVSDQLDEILLELNKYYIFNTSNSPEIIRYGKYIGVSSDFYIFDNLKIITRRRELSSYNITYPYFNGMSDNSIPTDRGKFKINLERGDILSFVQ